MPSSVGFLYSLGIFNFIHPLLQTFSNPIPPTPLWYPPSLLAKPEHLTPRQQQLKSCVFHRLTPPGQVFYFFRSLLYFIMKWLSGKWESFSHGLFSTIAPPLFWVVVVVSRKKGKIFRMLFFCSCDILSEIVGSDLAPR